MDFELLLFSEKSQKDYAYYLMEIFEKSLNIHFKFIEDQDFINLCLDCMTITIDLEEKVALEVIEEEFNFVADTSARIQVFSQFRDHALQILFKTINEIVKNIDYNLLLIGNGSNLILEKKNNNYYTSCLDDYYYFKIPFELLGVKIEEIKRKKS
jgi:predicted DNA-binding protein